MINQSFNLEEILKTHLQKYISITINGTEIKNGKFILFQNNILANNFYFELTIERIKKIDVVKIPFPFKVEHYPDEGLLYLDYRFTSLTDDKKQLMKIDSLKEKYTEAKLSKFLNTIVEVEFQ
jgi:hypothetical protein